MLVLILAWFLWVWKCTSLQHRRPLNLINLFKTFLCERKEKKKKTKQKLTSTNSLLMERHTPAFISQSKFLWKQNSDTHTHTKKMVSQVLIKKALQTSTKWSATSLLFWHRDCNHKTTGTTSGMIFTLETVYLSLPCTNKMNLDLWLGKKMFIVSIL